MRPTDQPEFLRTLNGLAAIKGKELTKEALALWWSAMSRWTIEDFKQAAAHLVSHCQFMPTPYDFTQLARKGEPTAGEAWSKVLAGWPLTPGSRIARAAAIVGGQYHITHANIEKELPFLERRFRDVYEELADVDVARDALPELTGFDALPDNRVSKALRVLE